MDVKKFFQKLESFCKGKTGPERCVSCEIKNFCYSPPANIKENCKLDEIIDFVNELQ